MTVAALISVIAGNLFHQSGGLLDQSLSRLRIRVENHILDAFEELGLDVVVYLQH